MNALPSLFVSHGAPSLLIEDAPARDFLAGLGARFPRPEAVIVLSAHSLARVAAVGTAQRYRAVHDFGGFPDALYRVGYAPPGDPVLAARILGALGRAGIPAVDDASANLDHGAWVPLKLVFPEADIPVVPVSLEASPDDRRHIALGRALSGLRQEGILVLGSGSLTHNLRDLGLTQGAGAPPAYVGEFAEWVQRTLEAGDEDALAAWRARAPHARRAHPTTEHFLPLLAAYGAGGIRPRAERLHASVTHGALAMDAYAFH